MTQTPTELGFAPIEASNLRESTYAAILGWLRGQRPGAETPLRIDAIAQALGVSPTPVREALARLAATGVITYLPRRGYRVAPSVTADELRDLFAARAALETAAVRLATELDARALGAALARARDAQADAAARLGVADDADATVEYLAADRAFHDAVIEHSGNRFLADFDERLGALAVRTRQTIQLGVHDAAEAIAEHEAIVARVAAGDAAGASAAMQSHIDAVLRRAVADTAEG